MKRRILGIDLGVTSSHQACVLDETCNVIARAKAKPTLASLEELERKALEGSETECELWVVIDPTGGAWLPVAVFFSERGHRVFRPNVEKTALLRRALSGRKKTNSIDAENLAKLAVWDKSSLHELELGTGDFAQLDRIVRASDRLTDEIARRKQRIRDISRMAIPTVSNAISESISDGDLAVLKAFGDPRELGKCELEELTELVRRASRGQLGRAKAEAYLTAAREAMELYQDTEAVAFEALWIELKVEIELLEAARNILNSLERRREELYRKVDPTELARSLPGIARIGGPTAVVFTARAGRFPDADHYVSYLGLAPRASETGDTDKKGQPITKAGNRKLRKTFIRAADHARKEDPELARIYFVHMTERGAHHNKAVTIVAAHLARRFWATMMRGTPYQLRDVDGRPVSRDEAKKIIAANYRVSTEVRERRRNRKRRKVPHHVHEGHVSKVHPQRATKKRQPVLRETHSRRVAEGGQLESLTSKGI